MELPRPVVVQHHRHLTLTLDFQGQIFKKFCILGMQGPIDWNKSDVSR